MGPGARVRDLHRDPARETHRTAGCASVIRVRAPFLPALLVVLAVVAALPLAVNNNSLREELFLMFMLITLASSINIIMGYTGYVSFGHIVFFGLGGYFAFYLMQNFNAHFLVAALAGAIPASAIALVIGVPILRLRGAYFALATIGINEAMRTAINNFEPFGGAVGMFFNFSVYDTYGGALRMAARLPHHHARPRELPAVPRGAVAAGRRSVRDRRARRLAAQSLSGPAGLHPVILQVEAVTVRFGGLVACDAATFAVEEGEVLGLIGPNGAGKTTLFNAINGVHRPRSGRIVFRREELTGLRPFQVARRGVAR